MPVLGQRKSAMIGSRSITKDPMYALAKEFTDVAHNILNESGVDLYANPTAAMNVNAASEALKDFYVNESAPDCDLEDMDDIFSYDNKDKMKDLAKITNLELLDIYGVDSITRFIKNDINKLSEEHLNKWIDFITYISNNKNIIDLSEHCLAIFKKQEI